MLFIPYYFTCPSSSWWANLVERTQNIKSISATWFGALRSTCRLTCATFQGESSPHPSLLPPSMPSDGGGSPHPPKKKLFNRLASWQASWSTSSLLSATFLGGLPSLYNKHNGSSQPAKESNWFWNKKPNHTYCYLLLNQITSPAIHPGWQQLPRTAGCKLFRHPMPFRLEEKSGPLHTKQGLFL